MLKVAIAMGIMALGILPFWYALKLSERYHGKKAERKKGDLTESGLTCDGDTGSGGDGGGPD